MRAFLIKYRWLFDGAGLLAALVGLYAALGFVLLPHLVVNAATDYVDKNLGRRLSIGELRFNPFRCEVNIAELRLREADGTPLLGFAALRVNADPLVSLFRRTITLQALELLQPDIALIVDADGSINLARLAPPATEPKAETDASLPRVHIVQLSIEDGRLGFEDRSRPEPFTTELRPIRLSLTDFRTEAGASSAYRFSAESAEHERLEWEGDVSVQPLGSNGRFRVSNLLLATIDRYLQDQLPVQLPSGSVEFEGSYQLKLQPALDVELSVPGLRVRDLAVQSRKAAATPAPVAVREIALETLQLSLAKREVTLARLSVDGAAIDLRRAANGKLNLQQLATPSAAADKTPAAPAAGASAPPPWRVAVGHIDVINGKLGFEDRSVTPAARLQLAPIRIGVDGYHSGDDAELKIDAALGINNSGKLRAQGDLRLTPLSTSMALDLNGFALPALQPYLNAATTARLEHGVLGAKLQLRYGEQARPKLHVGGDIGVSGFSARERVKGEEFAKWRQLNLRKFVYEQAPDRLAIDTVALQAPHFRVVVNADHTLNLGQLTPAAQPGAAAPAQPAASAQPSLPIRIDSVRIDEGSMYFADRSIDPSFAAGIVGLKGAVTTIATTPGTRSQIQLDGRVDRFAPVMIAGSAALFDPTGYTDLRLSFRNIELSTFNPYSGKFAGYNIAKGKLTTELAYQIDQRKLAAEHHVVVDQLEFGEATGSKDAAPLPIKLAVALLKDRHGVIDLNLPVNGSLDDPQFKYGTLVWQVVTNTLTKIVTAPFAALGRLFGGGEELAYLDFAPGATTLDAAQAGKLVTLARALSERPQLKLDVPSTTAAPDVEALARRTLAARVPDAAEASTRLKMIEKLYREFYGNAARYPNDADTPAAKLAFVEPAVRGRLAPDAAALDALARERAQAVQAQLLQGSQLAPERIFITTGRAGGQGDNGAVRMELKLQ